MTSVDLSQYKSPAPLLPHTEWEKKLSGGFSRVLSMIEDRQRRITEEGFPIITVECLDKLVQHIGKKTVFEVGAGTGYLARLLHDRGVNITAIDSQNGSYTRQQWWENDNVHYFPIEKLDVTTLQELPGDIVLMSWPCYESDFAYEVARRLRPGQQLIYQGESKGGCCANDRFFDYMSGSRRFARNDLDTLYEVHVCDFGVYDSWEAWLTIR